MSETLHQIQQETLARRKKATEIYDERLSSLKDFESRFKAEAARERERQSDFINRRNRVSLAILLIQIALILTSPYWLPKSQDLWQEWSQPKPAPSFFDELINPTAK